MNVGPTYLSVMGYTGGLEKCDRELVEIQNVENQIRRTKLIAYCTSRTNVNDLRDYWSLTTALQYRERERER